MSKYKFYNVAEVSPNTCLYTAAGTPFVRAGVVGSGTASIFDEVVQSSKQSKATGKVFAAERLQNGNDKCTVLCLASAKAGTDIEEGLAEQGFEIWLLSRWCRLLLQPCKEAATPTSCTAFWQKSALYF
uniref:Uroporphyrinogen-III synthase n=1 Tax=Nicotiana sylvestris TaxID=4096 RepID=A0A1U7XYE2_NICSY|nr:PREDICTED: uroporphyrinogen-III synthase, chloroplastic-like isoform X2 [Nicotiana sylvestris]